MMSTPAPVTQVTQAGRDRKKVATYCYQCVNGPDLLTVEVIDGVATRVEPNFNAHGEHPADGKVCVKPYGLVQKTYNPHRILKPMKRTNPRKGKHEEPGWVEISWDEALDLVAQKMRAIRDQGLTDENGNPRFAFSTGGAGTPMLYMGSFSAFFAAWGPIDMSLGAGGTVTCYHTEHLYGELWHRSFTVLPDTPRCDYIVAFGNNIDASGGVTSVRRQADARARGLKRVQVEPHLSVTGAHAEWIPIKPKTDSAFLYAMVHVLACEHDIDDLDVPFLKAHTAAPYLIGPNGYYLRDPGSEKPLLWDLKSNRAVPYDTPDTDPALTGTYTVDAVEIGADLQTWKHEGVEAVTAHGRMIEHMRPHTPEWAERVSGVPAAKIRQVANDFLEHARIGATTEVEGRTLPLRPVTIVLGKSVNNGWGAYECVWARTVLQVLVGGLEVPGGMLGSTTLLAGQEHDRVGSCIPGEDGFMKYDFNPTDRQNWVKDPEVRHGHRTLIPAVGNVLYSQPMGSSTFAWMRLQGRAAETWVKPNPPDVWMFYRCNPLISFAETDRLGETIAGFPFVVAFAYTLDETNHFADVLLPDCTDLEGTQLIRVGGTHYFEQFWESEGWVLRQPVVAPRGEAKDFTWIATELARRIGMLEDYNTMMNMGALGLPLKTDGYDYALDPAQPHSVEETWDALCKAASADLSGGKEANGLDWFKEHGYKTRPMSRLKWYLFPHLVDQGLRFELPYQERILRIGTQLANRLHESGVNWWDRQLHEYEALPKWKDLNDLWDSAHEEAYGIKREDFPFWLLTARSMQYSWGQNVSIQLMKEVAANVQGHDGIMMNAGEAERMGIADGDMIEVESPVGKTRGRVRLRHGVCPGVIVMLAQFGHWKTPYAKDMLMPSLNNLTPMLMSLNDGTGSTVNATKVRIRRLGGSV